MEYLKMFLILGPLLFLTGFVDSVAGGGGLISIPAYLFVGLPVHLASGTNKVVNGIGTASATWRFFRSGKIRMRIALWAAAGALGGAFIGARLALRMPEQILQTCLLIALPVVAVFLALKKDFGKSGSPAGKELPPVKEGVVIGGVRYAMPHRVKGYLEKDPCEGCRCPRDLCVVPCRVKRDWDGARKLLQ